MSQPITIDRTRIHIPSDIAAMLGAMLSGMAQGQQAAAEAQFVRVTDAPRIGQPWRGQGGIYGGVMRGLDGHSDYHLIVPTDSAAHIQEIAWGPTDHKVEGATSEWDGLANTKALVGDAKAHPAAEWAANLRIEDEGNIFTDLYLPSRREARLLASTVPELFADGWHWLSTQYSARSAWFQSFSGGDQNYLGKDGSWQARAVRRIPIIG